MKNLFENWRLFTEAKPTGKPPGEFSSWDDYWKWHAIPSPFADDFADTVTDLKPPESIRRPSATPPSLPPEARRPPPLPPAARIDPDDIGAGLPTGDPRHRRPGRSSPPGAGPAQTPKGAPTVAFPQGEKMKELGKVLDNSTAEVRALDRAGKRWDILDRVRPPVPESLPEPPIGTRDASLAAENKAYRRLLDEKNKVSAFSKARYFGRVLLGVANALFWSVVAWEVYKIVWPILVEKYPEWGQNDHKAVALAIAVFDTIATEAISVGELLMYASPATLATYKTMFPDGSRAPTKALMQALGIADEVAAAEELEAKKRVKREMGAEKLKKAAKERRGDPTMAGSKDVEPPAWIGTPPEPDFGPVPDEDLRENFKRAKKVKKLNIIIS